MSETAFPGTTTYPDHGGIGAVGRQPLTLQAQQVSVLAMTASPVTVGSVGAGTVTATHGIYPGVPVYPGIYPGHGSDLAMNQPSTRTLAVTPV